MKTILNTRKRKDGMRQVLLRGSDNRTISTGLYVRDAIDPVTQFKVASILDTIKEWGCGFDEARERFYALKKEREDTKQILVSEAFKSYMTTQHPFVSDMTFVSYQTVEKHLNNYLIGELKLIENLSTDFFIGFRDYLLSKGYTNSSVVKYLTVLHGGLRSLGNFNMKKVTQPLKDQIRNFNHLSLEEMEAFSRVKCKSESEKLTQDMFIISYWLGLRHSEFTQLKSTSIIDVELKDGSTIKVLRFLQKKQDKMHQVYIPPHVLHMLYGELSQPYPTTAKNLRAILSRLGDTFDDLKVKEVAKGGKILREDVRKKFLITFHSARHSCAARMRSEGFSDENVAQQLGINVQTVRNWYADRDDSILWESQNEIYKNKHLRVG